MSKTTKIEDNIQGKLHNIAIYKNLLRMKSKTQAKTKTNNSKAIENIKLKIHIKQNSQHNREASYRTEENISETYRCQQSNYKKV